MRSPSWHLPPCNHFCTPTESHQAASTVGKGIHLLKSAGGKPGAKIKNLQRVLKPPLALGPAGVAERRGSASAKAAAGRGSLGAQGLGPQGFGGGFEKGSCKWMVEESLKPFL